ncbi:MAG: hypothetical protein GX138_00175 [Firmicutes bacterium]|nr:hypothetical protein [Bacillota bacterium]
MAESYILAIDGGGTRTRAVLADTMGNILGHAEGGPANYKIAGLHIAKESLRAAINGAFAAANLPVQDVAVGYFGLAAVGRDEDREVIKNALKEFAPRYQRLILDNDGIIAMTGATVAKPGVVVISGTGSMIYGRNQENQTARSGGWGPIIGDEGGGYEIGRQGLMAVMRQGDGRGPKTALTESIFSQWNVTNHQQLAAKVYHPETQRPHIAVLSILVKQAAAQGDEVARKIIAEAIEQLALAATAVIRELKMEEDEFPVALVGGGFSEDISWAQGLEDLIRQVAPKSYLSPPVYHPVIGALLSGLQLYHGELSQDILDNVNRSVYHSGSAAAKM